MHHCLNYELCEKNVLRSSKFHGFRKKVFCLTCVEMSSFSLGKKKKNKPKAHEFDFRIYFFTISV